MSGFYVLDMPDFAPLVETARKSKDCTVHAPVAGYTYVEFAGEIEIDRVETGLGTAVWFGCLTGGLNGRIVEFTSDKLRLAPTNAAIFE